MEDRVIEKIYAGFLGMNVGMRLGAPIENPYWTYERLWDAFGDIRGYVRDFHYFAADDDVNGPVIFLRTLTDPDGGRDFSLEQAGETWLNYTRCGHGMFWWGGEDVSTEHRAYMNLRRGMTPPDSGSIAQNGPVAAQQIGGQIFVDTWGLVCPGDPVQAARFARKMASVSHDGEALNGAAFMAGCVAAAFDCRTVDQVLDAGLRLIPEDCDYRRVVDAVRAFHRAHPEDFRACRDFVEQQWGNDRFPGGYHIIPNAGICVLALLYGGGDLGRTIEIACMCGFDTDCNASNTGTITGVLGGLEGVPARYRDPMNDNVVLSSVSGYLNMLDAAAYSKELAATACWLRAEVLPQWLNLPRPGELRMDFELPGSTHGLELSDRGTHWIRPVETVAHTGRRSLELMIDGKEPPPADLFFKAFFLEKDFQEARYEQVFSPRVYPGQTVSCWMLSRQEAPATITIRPFVTAAMTERRLELPPVTLENGAWQQVRFTVPDLRGDQADRVGWNVTLTPETPPWALGRVFVDDITVYGPMDYTIDLTIQRRDNGQITPFSFNDCQDALLDGALRTQTDTGGQGFTGNYYLRDGSIEARVIPEGDNALLLIRAQGTRRFYALGLESRNRAIIARQDGGQWTLLAETGCLWAPGTECRLRAEASGPVLKLFADGVEILEAADTRFDYGMVGLCHSRPGAARWMDFHITGTV